MKRGLVTTGHHLPYNPALKARVRELRNDMTPAESKLWYEYLKSFRYPVSRQRPIDNYIVDFYCPGLKLVIEIDGDTHCTDDGKIYEERRTHIMESYGLRVLRFTNIDVLDSLEGVCQEIDSQIAHPSLQQGVSGQIAKTPKPPLRKGGRPDSLSKSGRGISYST